MNRQRRSNANLIIGVWIVSLAIIGGLIATMGPSPSRIALVSTSDGLFITFGAIYALGAAVASIFSMLLIHWRITGLDGFFEFQDARNAYTTPTKRVLIVAAYSLAALLTCYFLFVRLNGTVLRTMPHDVFAYYDGAERLAHGQLQHVEFHTPMGVLCNVIPYIGLKVVGGFAGSLETGCLLAAAFLLAIGSCILGTRYTVAAAIPIVFFLCLLAVVPLVVESSPELITTAMFYNRLGWVALTLLFMFYVEPRDQSPRLLPLDVVCLASLLLFSFYLKISYALVGLAFLPVMGLSSRYNRRLGLCTLAVFALAIGGLELGYGFHRGYIEDLRMSIKACGTNRGTMAPKFVANIREYLLAALAVALAIGSVRNKFSYVMLSGYIAAAGLAIIDQNTHLRGVICLLAIFVISQELIRRNVGGLAEARPADRPEVLKSLACLALILVFVVQPVAYGFASMTMIRSVLTQIKPELPGALNGMVFPEHLRSHLRAQRIQSKRTKELVSAPPLSGGSAAEQAYLAIVLDGVKVLQNVETSGQSVIAFDFVTPFSFILALEPPTGDSTCIAYGRTVSENSYTPADEMLGAVDFVMVPHEPLEAATTDFLLRTYGPYLERHFEQIEQSKYWTLWGRIAAPE